MKKALDLLGISFLLTIAIVLSSSQVYAEFGESGEGAVEKTTNNSIEEKMQVEGNSESTEKTEDTENVQSIEENTKATRTTENALSSTDELANNVLGAQLVEEPSLTITEVNFDQTTNTLTGKTAPNATVYMYVPSTMGQGFVRADANGVFTVTDQFSSGLEILLTASDSQGRKGESYSYKIPERQVSDLKITQVEYDQATNTLTGKTAPNATVGMYVPSTKGQGFVRADANGVFIIRNQFRPGLVMVLTPSDSQGRVGESYSFKAPEVSASDFLRIIQVDYNHKAQTLSGRTAPDAKVSIGYLGGNEIAAIYADGNGYFSFDVELKPGNKIVLIANDTNRNWGEEYTFIVPEAIQIAKNNTTTQESKTNLKEDAKGSLPHTGTTQNSFLTILGVFSLLFGLIIIHKKKVLVFKK
ncbi:LPXTG cell wall anchor domain-containing protein [Enterococcus sp. UD-01]|jgi:LPXTG-motif cell wall-anchored protein|uniref:LPXTG cell wall anchor domain-containing protein n=1 Tax=Enterococcus sp. UD-01 TaxID=3373911 RepID=UPI00383317EA